jgi:hypothetical protein
LQRQAKPVADHPQLNDIDAPFATLDLAYSWLLKREALP